MKLPGGGEGKNVLGVGKGDPNLNEFSFLDVMPNELIIDILRRVCLRNALSVDNIPGELSILDDGLSTNEMMGYSSTKVAMRWSSWSKL